MNFIAPNLKTLRKDFASNVPTTAKQPGVIEDNIKLMKSTNSDVSYKICIDGKKISSGFGKELGDVDLFGFEEKPTLEERQSQLKMDLDSVHNIDSMLGKLEDKGHTIIDSTDAQALLPWLEKNREIACARLKELRQMAQKKNQVLSFLKRSAGLPED